MTNAPAIYFASGSNRVADITGLSEINFPIGVAVDELTEAAIVALENLAGSDLPVFVDSGAFSEVTFGANGPSVVKPITDADWKKRLAVYKRLAVALGSQLYVVAPDMVGFQTETFERLLTYRNEVEEIAALGANVMVVMQLGTVSQFRMFEIVGAMLACDWMPALPCKKAATSTDQVVDFVNKARPERVHLLGLGATNAKAPRLLARLAMVSPELVVQLDSCFIRANVGRTNGPGGGPRSLTAARDAAEAAGAHGEAIQRLGVVAAFGGRVLCSTRASLVADAAAAVAA